MVRVIMSQPRAEARYTSAALKRSPSTYGPGVIAVSSASPEEFMEYIKADSQQWSDIIEKAGIKAD